MTTQPETTDLTDLQANALALLKEVLPMGRGLGYAYRTRPGCLELLRADGSVVETVYPGNGALSLEALTAIFAESLPEAQDDPP